jgi:hypothetical protein
MSSGHSEEPSLLLENIVHTKVEEIRAKRARGAWGYP